jgi:hypothetical protein
LVIGLKEIILEKKQLIPGYKVGNSSLVLS